MGEPNPTEDVYSQSFVSPKSSGNKKNKQAPSEHSHQDMSSVTHLA